MNILIAYNALFSESASITCENALELLLGKTKTMEVKIVADDYEVNPGIFDLVPYCDILSVTITGICDPSQHSGRKERNSNIR